MSKDVILSARPLGFPWETADPFLFCVHHDDAYPRGNDKLGPQASLQGRNIGMDFEGKDGWRMYHGESIPGFPPHPHRGFETITIVRTGHIDHSDSLGATARFGGGDVQWLTAGKGIVHSEMFPLLQSERDNPVELFQIWLNLPAKNKMAPPHFSMLWREKVPVRTIVDDAGKATTLTIVAGAYGDVQPLPPPPDSWASDASADVAVWTLALQPHARFTLPKANAGTRRSLFFFRGRDCTVAGSRIAARTGLLLRADADVDLVAGDDGGEFLLLQGRPIAEPVVQHGPFVMNTRAEIQQAFMDYQQTQFGGWPFPTDEPVHARDAGRFARHPDGRVERP